MSLEELKGLKEKKLEIEMNAFEVNEGICKDCSERLIKVVENRSIFDGAITFHIIKLKCMNCGKKYMDLNQAEKYDLLLKLEKTREPLKVLAEKVLA